MLGPVAPQWMQRSLWQESSGASRLLPVPWLTSEEPPALATAARPFGEALGQWRQVRTGVTCM